MYRYLITLWLVIAQGFALGVVVDTFTHGRASWATWTTLAIAGIIVVAMNLALIGGRRHEQSSTSGRK